MATGTVKWFNETKGYGFIQPFAEGREFEQLEGTAPVPAQGPAWAHRCGPRHFGSTEPSIGLAKVMPPSLEPRR